MCLIFVLQSKVFDVADCRCGSICADCCTECGYIILILIERELLSDYCGLIECHSHELYGTFLTGCFSSSGRAVGLACMCADF